MARNLLCVPTLYFDPRDIGKFYGFQDHHQYKSRKMSSIIVICHFPVIKYLALYDHYEKTFELSRVKMQTRS